MPEMPTQPFHANFHVLSAADALDDYDPDDHTARMRAFHRQQSALTDFSGHVLRQGERAAMLT